MPTALFTADERSDPPRLRPSDGGNRRNHEPADRSCLRHRPKNSSVRRHGRLRPRPWISPLPSSDLFLTYQDVLFALQPDKGANNGSPSLHARLLAELDIQIGDRIAHIGAGTGCYSAILSELVGASGHVCAVEMDPDLAAHAQTALADRANVSVINADGSQWPQEAVDAIYVNFAVARPRGTLDRKASAWRASRAATPPKGGRHLPHSAALRFERGEGGFAARWVGTAYFVCANGGLTIEDIEIEALTAAFRRGGIEFVKEPALEDGAADRTLMAYRRPMGALLW